MAASSTTQISARDGTQLLVRRWPAATEPWARVLLVHGLAEHSGRWEHVGAQLAKAGLDVTSYDQRGFGASGGRRAWVDRWSELHDDLEEQLVAVRASGPEPVVLYGHSLGGLIALGYVLDGRPSPDALVLSAPALSSSIPGWKQALGRLIAAVRPTAELSNGLDPDDLSHDAEVAAAYLRDPRNVHRSTVGFGVRAFEEQSRLASMLDRLAVPTFVIHGGADRIVPTESSSALEARPGVRRRVYPELRHELHNEADGPRVIDDVVAWLREVLRIE
jgi:alpha-beta hydrolase superfamily lysophospholipase